jgi:hypothetical protein
VKGNTILTVPARSLRHLVSSSTAWEGEWGSTSSTGCCGHATQAARRRLWTECCPSSPINAAARVVTARSNEAL